MQQRATGTVVNGRIVLDDDKPLPEGARVLVRVFPDAGDVELTPEEEAELIESDAEIDRGEFITLEEFRNQRR